MFRSLLLLACVSTALGQIAFEVASVKLAKPDAFRRPAFPLDPGDAYARTGGRFSAVFPLTTYIRFAYKLSLAPEGLPKWAATDRFDIEARAAGNPTKDEMRLMMRSLLAERFGFAAHFENREMPIFALTLIKPGTTGPKLRPHADGSACDAHERADVFPEICKVYELLNSNGTRRAGSRDTTLALLAGALPTFTQLGRPVIDRTGLTGTFDFVLEWAPDSVDPPSDPQGATFFQALQEQLGLKMEATRGAVEILVVDHVDRPSEN